MTKNTWKTIIKKKIYIYVISTQSIKYYALTVCKSVYQNPFIKGKLFIKKHKIQPPTEKTWKNVTIKYIIF